MNTTLTQPISVCKNYSLGQLNSLRVESTAEEYVRATSVPQLEQAVDFSGPLNVLGGGSNLLLFPKIRGRIVHVGIRGITVKPASNSGYSARVGAGESWHQFVLHTLERGISGLENLALIPGYVGGAPYQNIGAYGRELAELVRSVEVYDLEQSEIRVLSKDECQFSYRNSVFRTNTVPRMIITHVNLLLGTLPYATAYRDVHERLSGFAAKDVDHDLIAKIVMRIRRQKLPNLEKYPNVGSFFQNPNLTTGQYDRLRGKLDVVGFSHGATVRVPAARLIDARKWKGKQIGNVSVWHRQPLVLVNNGGAHASEFYDVANRIADDVERHFDIRLELEPVVLGKDL